MEIRLQLKIVSLLLQYPDTGLTACLDAIEEASREMSGQSKTVIRGFLAHLGRTPMIRLQEEYTRLFDLNPSTCLNLSYHKWGNEKKRGEGLARLGSLYRQEGFEPASNELTDFLPMVLEFLSIATPEAASLVLNELGNEIHGLALRLREMGSPYGDLMELIEGEHKVPLHEGEGEELAHPSGSFTST
jgi:nitrate reductase delta subunit